jgi:hypothetical protein
MRPSPVEAATPGPETTMPNTPEHAARKRTPSTDRQNAQGDHEGSPHRPEEFDQLNPAKQTSPEKSPNKTGEQ